MIPVELIIEGIYSYKERTRVDFQPLLAAQLFGIFGAVGSGKSSLLEAITFALYGQVERMTRRDSLAANMFNLEANQALIQFTFDSLVDGQRYRCLASGKRRKQGPDLIREFFQLTEDGPLPIDESQIHQAIGLSYDHFTRTVIVPQGKFQAFLQLSDRERTDMLQHLFHLHRFDLSGPLRSLAGKTRGEEQHLSGQLASLERWLTIPLDDLRTKKGLLDQDVSNCRRNLDLQSKRLALLQQYVKTLHALTQSSMNQERLGQELKTCNAALSYAREALSIAQTKAAQLPVLEAREADLRRCLEIQDVQSQLEQANAQLQTRSASIEPVRQRLAENQQAADQMDQQMAVFKANQVPVNEYTDRQTWMVQFNQLESQRLDKERSGRELKERVEELVSKQTRFWQAVWDEELIGSPLPADPEKMIPTLFNQLEEKRTDKEETLRQGKHQAGISSFADLLKPGQACPLCGSVHHPAPVSAEDRHQHISSLERDLLNIQDAIHALRSWQDQSRDQHNQLALEKERLEHLRKDYQQLLTNHQQLTNQLSVWQLDVQGLKTWLAEQQDLSNQISQLQTALQANRQQHLTFARQLEDLSDQTRNLDQQRMRWTGRLDTLLDQVMHMEDREHMLECSADTIKQLITEQQQTRTSIIENLENQQRTVQIRETEYLQTEVRLRELDKAMVDLSHSLDVTVTAIRELMPEWEEQSWREEPAQLLGIEETVHASLQEQLTRHVASLTLLDNQIRETTERMEEARVLTDTLKQVQVKLDNLKTMEGLFRAKGMVDFAASRYLRQILEHANQRFYKMTRHKLRLELSEDLRIMVRDYYHGGAVRSVKTLSGGQLFQASLALALSLAEQIRSHRKGERDFFFLDEGFGTQDRESLMVVLDTLKALREENRSVGIISHVEDLQQEVNASLRIQLDPVRGSLIESSH